MTDYQPGDEVQSTRFGQGRVEFDKGQTVIVRFAHGLEEVRSNEIQRQNTVTQAIAASQWSSPLHVIARMQAEAILSVSSRWSVFSRSRITLLPHQLWVCKRVLERWPTHWLIADDVGLGKTIEAGLILWPLLSSKRVERLLILAPASLVPQWQERLRELFDIRLERYVASHDTPRADPWGGRPRQIIASLQTLRLDRNGRHHRLLDADPWDLVIVDEAHHLNADELTGTTLGYRLIQHMLHERRIISMLFFTGTPHRGKEWGFWSLLHLLKPDEFHPRLPKSEQLPRLRGTMIRNNKQNVTDLRGNRLFQPPVVTTQTYRYNLDEARFYDMLTDFILTGKAYASTLGARDQRMARLILIAMQKLAASSIAAIRQALRNRLDSIERTHSPQSTTTRHQLMEQYEEFERDEDFDQLSKQEEGEVIRILLPLMNDEPARLRELIHFADLVTRETKLSAIVDTLDNRFRGRSVLLFTEYKATQSMLMSMIMQRFGDNSVTFINGDERAENIIDASGTIRTLRVSREDAAHAFTTGEARFLVSTEAGGEGIDLQQRCYTLIHVDLPWSPMRLHQRVGRLNRYGQSQRVEVVSFLNPDTVEARIWEKLNEKLDVIVGALGYAMDDPEDLRQLVLGMASPRWVRDLFADAAEQSSDTLASWFDMRTATFGGRDVVATVKDLIGHSAHFDFAEVSDQIPKVDLPDLKPFLRVALHLEGRQLREDEQGLSFRTPESWAREPRVRPSYEGLLLDRQSPAPDANKRILGVGSPVMDVALRSCAKQPVRVGVIPAQVRFDTLVIFQLEDRLTATSGMVTKAVIGVMLSQSTENVIWDWEVLVTLNSLVNQYGLRRLQGSGGAIDPHELLRAVERAQRRVEQALPSLGLPFELPVVTPLAILAAAPVPQGLKPVFDFLDESSSRASSVAIVQNNSGGKRSRLPVAKLGLSSPPTAR
ncbi:MAG: hypothetical protein KatS3mg060_2567 [Dehalococcoidia bacterium]|nr:MAG: hypothetical protein KatS3mg060_2567 [Dehalococcoidia bacterium]